jgi:hypothetical protein
MSGFLWGHCVVWRAGEERSADVDVERTSWCSITKFLWSWLISAVRSIEAGGCSQWQFGKGGTEQWGWLVPSIRRTIRCEESCFGGVHCREAECVLLCVASKVSKFGFCVLLGQVQMQKYWVCGWSENAVMWVVNRCSLGWWSLMGQLSICSCSISSVDVPSLRGW